MPARNTTDTTVHNTLLDNLGIDALNAMQAEAIDAFRRKKAVVLLAPTGSGKTLAFVLPLIERLAARQQEKALVLVPSRELAAQTVDVVRRTRCAIPAMACYGGRPAMDEHRTMQQLMPRLVVATPGRAADHLRKGNLRGEEFQTLVIDEFDKSLELGFRDEMSEVIALLPLVEQRMLLSATDATDIPHFVGSDFMRLDFLDADDERICTHIVRSPEKDKLHALDALLRRVGQQQSVVFVAHRESVERVASYLRHEGFAVSAYHGGMEQRERERQLYRFVGCAALTLVCTDLAARGLDIPAVAHVIHYHLPATPDVLTHRNGRTARWDRQGDAWLLTGPEEQAPDFCLTDSSVHADTPLFPAGDATHAAPVPKPLWASLYIGRGRKDKISRADVVGFLSKVGGLARDELGRVDVGEHWAYAAVAAVRLRDVLARTRGQKIKGQRTLIEPTKP